MNKTLKTVLITIVVIFGILFLVGLTANDNPTKSTKDLSLRGAFMEECALAEGMRDYCGCTYDYMVDKYGRAGFMNIAVDYYKTNETPPEFTDAIDACLSEL